jgi:LacI family transcriptional regulator
MSAVSIREVAARAGVSVGTVSNVLNNVERVTPAMVDRVNAAIAELGYVRNDAARQLRAGQSTNIGIVVLDLGNPFFTDVIRGAEQAADEAGLSVLVGNSDDEPEREATYLELFETHRVLGVLISPYGDVDARLASMRSRGIPAVLVDRLSGDGATSSVSVDDVAGGRIAVSHLLERGRRRVAFVGGPASIRQVADRLAGAGEAVDAVPGATLEQLATHSLTVLEGRRIGEHLVSRPAAARPDAIFAANDLVAVGLLQALVMKGAARVPDDIMIVGYDDIDFASAAVVPLTSVRQPSRALGATAVRLLLELASGAGSAQSIRFTPHLVIRESTGG